MLTELYYVSSFLFQLGPLSDNFRKTILAVPFIGHLIAGVIPFIVVYIPQCPPQVRVTLTIPHTNNVKRNLITRIPLLKLSIAQVFFTFYFTQVIWLSNIHLLFGGFPVLQIAMFAHISNVTTPK